jgi:plastocyanin
MLSVAACGGYAAPPTSTAPSPAPAPTAGGVVSSVAIPGGAETLGNRAYSPDSLSVATGSTVTWTNTDVIAHTSTSDGNAWNSQTILPGGRFSFTFQTAGTYTYHCTIHPGMVGTVMVQ